MDALDRLSAATLLAQRQDDLPDYLAERIFALIAAVRQQGGLQGEINDLAAQVALYDNYGQTGYIGMGVDSGILEASLRRIERQLDTQALRREHAGND